MTRNSIREYAEAVRERYRAAGKREKEVILDEFCQNTGYHRKSAIRRLNHPSLPVKGRRAGRKRTYDLEVVPALKVVWEASDHLCSKRLAPSIPNLLSALVRHGELQVSEEVYAQLVGLSPATIDRLLKPYRQAGLRRPYSSGRSANAIKSQIPIRTFGEWEEVGPGSLQADLVAHCGESTEGFYLTTLVGVDVKTAWTELEGVWGKGQQRVGTGAHRIRCRLPFRLVEWHTDNGSEFINDILYTWCKREGIRFTRGRPYKKNDQAYVEQKNWVGVRRLVGYDRYCTKAAYVALGEVYKPLRLYLNFFQPVRKLVSKERVGGKVKKRFDRAQTPYERLLAAEVLDEERKRELAALHESLNPLALRRQIEERLEALWRLAERPQPAKVSAG